MGEKEPHDISTNRCFTFILKCASEFGCWKIVRVHGGRGRVLRVGLVEGDPL